MSRDRDNFGPGSFSDTYDNRRSRSLDDDMNRGGVTGFHFEDDVDLDDMDFTPKKGEAFRYPGKRSEPSRDADLARGAAGTSWNTGLNDHQGKGPKGWKLTDERLKERVNEVLLHSHDVDPSELEVLVQDRVVTLRGKIKSKGMRTVAEDLVLSIPGVEDVFSQLKISDTSNFQLSRKALREARDTDLS